jgi:hypothetical protein
MRNLLTPVFILFFAYGCASANIKPQNISLHEQLLTLDNTIEATADNAVIALDNDLISIKRACEIHEYSRLAASIVDQAWNALFLRQDDTVESYIEAAKQALLGVSAEAKERTQYNCAGLA